MAKHLLIVESPAKAKTIEKYLGSDYQVLSSYGHIRDLPKSGINIDIEHNFEPTYAITDDKKKTVSALKKAMKGKDVYLATDEDREGEAISWHLCEALKLDPKTTKRIVFNEITKDALVRAVEQPRHVDINLVNAQQARRVLDRLVGYELSPVIWKKIRTGLSAGRVQSVAVRIIVEREREIEEFKSKATYRVTAEFSSGTDVIPAELKAKLESKEKVTSLFESIKDAKFIVSALEKKAGKKSPAPPFTTSTLQQTASSKLGYSVKQTMVLAQRLYEAGKITYMRTDSLNLSQTAINQASKLIETQYGKEYLNTRHFKTKSAGAQEAHEAIRPTDFSVDTAGEDAAQQKLYNLIRSRALASQMSEAKIERTILTVKPDKSDAEFVAKGEIVIFDGFLKVMGKMADDIILPSVTQGQELKRESMMARETFDRPPARYTEASLVKKLESEGIGRPSTYAPTISTIQTRLYVEKASKDGEPRDVVVIKLDGSKVSEEVEQENYGVEKNKLFPTDIGKVVSDFLVKNFPGIVDYQFTAKVEKEFDKIADGKEKWNTMIADFYGPFHKLIEKSDDITRQEATQGRVLGKDPKSGKPVIARVGRYGAMIQIGEAEDEEKPKFAPLPPGKQLTTVTLDEALEMFKLPRTIGETKEGEEITTNIGRFGPYVKFNNTFVSIKGEDPFTITHEKAMEFIDAKKKADKEKLIQDFVEDGIQVLNGRYGPYITDGKVNGKIPKDTDPKKITLKQAKEILAERAKAPKGRYGKKPTKKR
ncbi:MAG: type I DNA topoisomerase [Candidatus Saccharibacteria bacterium]